MRGIERFGGRNFILDTVSIDTPLPPLLDDTSEFLRPQIKADLVLDYLKHPDLSQDLALICRGLDIPVVASGKKTGLAGVMTPPTCCGLSRQASLGLYGRMFGAPEFKVNTVHGKIDEVLVLRGAPCGATWHAVERVVGLTTKEAGVRLGLEIQFFCTADPSAWDPLFGKSPVHFAGHIHRAALDRAISGACTDYPPAELKNVL